MRGSTPYPCLGSWPDGHSQRYRAEILTSPCLYGRTAPPSYSTSASSIPTCQIEPSELTDRETFQLFGRPPRSDQKAQKSGTPRLRPILLGTAKISILGNLLRYRGRLENRQAAVPGMGLGRREPVRKEETIMKTKSDVKAGIGGVFVDNG